jgi:hypothetical protein
VDNVKKLVVGKTASRDMKPLVCTSCNASIRFIPLYQFSRSGDRTQIMMGPLIAALVKCGNCNQMYRWQPPTDQDPEGGWVRDSMFEEISRAQEHGQL